MRVFIAVLVLIFSFQSWTKADDISDFEIEGMSIGDSLLDYFTEDEIKKALTETELQGESRYYFESNLLVYDRLRIYVLNKNNKIVSITGENFIKYEKCLNLQKEIIIEFNNLFDLSSAQIGELSDFVTVNDPTGKSFFTDYSIYFKNDDVVYIRCFNYTEESEMGDRMEVAVVLKVHRDIIKKSIGSAKEK